MRRAFAILFLSLVASVWVTALIAAPFAGRPTSVKQEALGSEKSNVTNGTGSPSGVASASILASGLIYTAGSLICHQNPERSFYLNGAQLPVCARCLGLYAGGALGMIGWGAVAGLRRRASARAARAGASPQLRRVLVLIALPTVLSVVVAWLGWWDLQNGARAMLAIPLGAVVGAVVCAVAAGDLR